MTRMRRIGMMACVLVVITLTVTLLCGSAAATSTNDLRKIVTFKNINLKTILGYTTALAVVTATGSTVVHNLSIINSLAITLPASDTTKALTRLLNNLYVLEVADDLLTLVDPICPTTALYPIPETYRWGMQQIEVAAVHSEWQGSGVKVAILDTGIDWTHLTLGEFMGRGAGGYNAIAPGASAFDDHGHGTHMAGIIAAAMNGVGVIGAAPQAKVASVKVLDHHGAGNLSDVINGLQWVYNSGIRLVNMSFGFTSDNAALKKAIQTLYNKDVIMIAAAGNRCAAASITDDGGGDDCGPSSSCSDPLTAITYPAAYQSWVIAVGATDRHDHIAAYSLSGPQLDVVAPGGTLEAGAPDNGQILSTNTGGVYGLGRGTSQAAAHVAGAVSLALQVDPTISVTEVRNLLQKTAVDLHYPADQQGAGRIDVKHMIEELLQ